jgi:hypothetical protein
LFCPGKFEYFLKRKTGEIWVKPGEAWQKILEEKRYKMRSVGEGKK